MDFGQWDFRHWSEERIDEYWKYFEQIIRSIEKDAKANGGQGVVSIADFDGFQLNHQISPGGKKSSVFRAYSDMLWH